MVCVQLHANYSLVGFVDSNGAVVNLTEFLKYIFLHRLLFSEPTQVFKLWKKLSVARIPTRKFQNLEALALNMLRELNKQHGKGAILFPKTLRFP